MGLFPWVTSLYCTECTVPTKRRPTAHAQTGLTVDGCAGEFSRSCYDDAENLRIYSLRLLMDTVLFYESFYASWL